MSKACIRLIMAALICAGLTGLAMAEGAPPPQAPPAAPESAAPATSNVQEAIDAELALRMTVPVEAWREAQHLSWHMCFHLGHKPERYHHHERFDADRYHYRGKGRIYASAEAEAAARKAAEAELAAEKGGQPCFYEQQCAGRRACNKKAKRTHVFLANGGACCHSHHHGIIWANEWERAHKRYYWKVQGDIAPIGVAAVPPCEGHAVPPPRPVRWNDSNATCPLGNDVWFKPPPERTVVVPFPLPREGDWRAHISPLMNKIVDQTDWLRVVTVPPPPQAEPVQEIRSRPEGD